jgi:hypothetical protein
MRKQLLVTILAGVAATAVVGAQMKNTALPRTADGHPDLTGTYDLAMLTPLERPSGMPAILSDEQAAKLEKQVVEQNKALDRPIEANRSAPPKGGDGSLGPAGNVGGYNNFWLDRGSEYSIVDGQRRTSIVVDPPDGHVPAVTPDARQRQMSRLAQFRPTSDQTESKDPGLEPAGSYDDPERRPLGERCLLGFGSTSGPPILPNYFYNNLHEIVQTPTQVMILTEMVHDARIVRMNAKHLPSTIRMWLGDSIGSWDGDTLVVDTTNFTDKTRFRGSTDDMHVVERFTRVDGKTLKYRFTIDDAKTWSKPWTGEYTWPATDERVFEYACHEGNYAIGNILRGARLREKETTDNRK